MYTYEKNNKQGVLNITFSSQEFEKECQNVYEKTKGKYKVQGFRNGKAPRKVIEQTYGDTVFFDDAFDNLLSEEFTKFLTENQEVRPAGYPQLKDSKFTADKGVQAVLVFDLMPEVELGSFSGLKAKLKPVTVSKERIEDEIKRLQDSHARFVEADKVAEKGDFATIDFVGSVNGVKFDGGAAQNYKLELGSHTFIEGFEEQVEGMKVGQKKDVKVTFPQDYHAENLKGKEAVFEVTLNKVEKKELPEVNDKFISDVTEFETLEEYKKEIEKNIKAEGEKQAKLDYEAALIDEVTDRAKVELSENMIHEEVHDMIHEFEHRLSHQGMKLADYLSYLGITEEEFEKQRWADAEKNLKTRLVLQKIISEQKFTVSSEDVDKKIADYAANYGISADEVKKSLQQQDMSYFQNQAMMQKVIDFIKEQNK